MLPPALSTMWMQIRHEGLDEFAHASRALGFRAIELSPVVSEGQLQRAGEGARGMVRVLHHPCPADGTLPELSDPDPARRQRAIAGTIRTMEWAQRLGAQAVVLHLGEVAADRRWENALRARWLQGDQAGLTALRARLVAMRQSLVAPFLDAAQQALSELRPVARALGLAVGVETGEWLFSIPTLDEARALLAAIEPPIGLWVDTGHATIQERLGGAPLAAWLQLAPERLVGLHYHDVCGLRDHLIPGRGSLAWEALKPWVPTTALPTCELDWYYEPSELVAGVTRLARAGLVAPLTP